MELGNSQKTTEPTDENADDPMQNLAKLYFANAQLEAANTTINEVLDIVEKSGGKTIYNFKLDDGVPEGYALIVSPIKERDSASATMVVTGVTIAVVPEFDTLMAHETGEVFIKSAIQSAIIAKVANAARNDSPSIPFSITDFTTTNRADGLLAGFKSLASTYVKLLKDRKVKHLTVDVLRQVLQSAASAEKLFPFPQKTWETILQSMITKCNERGTEPGMLTEWMETRDTAGLPDVAEIDLSDMDFAGI